MLFSLPSGISVCSKELTVKFTDTTFAECQEIADLILEDCLPDGHSFLVENSQDEILSFTIANDFAQAHEDSHPITRYIDNHRHFSMVGHLEDYLETRYAIFNGFARHKFPAGRTMQILMGGTDPQFRNQGLNTLTFIDLVEHCSKLGYIHLMSNSTSPYTRQMVMNRGMEAWASVSISDWYPKGSIYARCVPHGLHDVVLVVLDITKI